MSVLVEKPYQFVPPHRGNLWPSFIQRFRIVDWYLRKHDGVVSYECRHLDRFAASLSRGDAILLAPNHCRYADPLTMVWPARLVKTHVHAIASWHLFAKSWFDSFAIQKMGGFSLFREGTDRQSLETAIEVLAEAQRPLILFPEGATNRTNDVLQPLLDGVAFIARTAAKRRLKASGGRVVIHPVGIKYLFRGDIEQWSDAALGRLEQRLGWRTLTGMPLVERVGTMAEALLSTREARYLGQAQPGSLPERRDRLIQAVLERAEMQFGVPVDSSSPPIARVRKLRSVALPQLQQCRDAMQRRELYHSIDAFQLAQDLAAYPDQYLLDRPVTDTQVLETIERMEEAMIGKPSHPGPLHVVLEFAPEIPVDPERKVRGEVDPLMQSLESSLREMLGRLAAEANVVVP